MGQWRQKLMLIALLAAGAALPCSSQVVPPPAPVETRPAGPTPAAPPERQVSWKLLLPNVIHDQKPIWLFPATVAQGKHIEPTLAFLSVTGGLIALDPIVTPYFRRNQSGVFDTGFSGRNTSIAMAAFPSAFYLVGLARKDTYAKHTVLLAGEAVLDSEILTTVMKDLDRRLLPDQVQSHSDFSDTWFLGHGRVVRGTGSFPSGHTIAAFSIATVFADRYPRPRWHRWLAFGLAGLVGCSRIPLQAHYPSDVFAGAVLGYTIAHYVVLKPQ
jgi:membrane-associated phospholipid phosphatase